MTKTASPQPPKDVLFYVLNSDTAEAREAFVCKLINTIYKKQRKSVVRFGSTDEVNRFDRQLWAWKPTAFLPHAIEQQYPAPIQLFSEKPNPNKLDKDVLINLHPEFPEFFGEYQRTIEVLDQSAYLLQMGRERWKAYRKSGIEPTIHKIGFD